MGLFLDEAGSGVGDFFEGSHWGSFFIKWGCWGWFCPGGVMEVGFFPAALRERGFFYGRVLGCWGMELVQSFCFLAGNRTGAQVGGRRRSDGWLGVLRGISEKNGFNFFEFDNITYLCLPKKSSRSV